MAEPALMGELSSTEAAALLGVHPKTLIEWVEAGRLRAVKTPGGRHRFHRADLEAFASARTTGPDPT